MPTESLTDWSPPSEESQSIEFKSGRTETGAAAGKLRKAASAFWNSGGGSIFFGISDTGEIEPTFPLQIGRRSIEDWVADTLDVLQPVGLYAVIDRPSEQESGTPVGVLEVRFEESPMAPHMVDGCYYIRAGARTVPAPTYLVEALFARRKLTSPEIIHNIEVKPTDPNVYEVVVYVTGDEPAFDVMVQIHGVPAEEGGSDMYEHTAGVLRNVLMPGRPLTLDIFADGLVKRFNAEAKIAISYKDRRGNSLFYEKPLGIRQSMPAEFMSSSRDAAKVPIHLERIAQTLEGILSRMEASFPELRGRK